MTEMSTIQSSIDAWHVTLTEFDSNICASEDDVCGQLKLVLDQMQQWLKSNDRWGIRLFFISSYSYDCAVMKSVLVYTTEVCFQINIFREMAKNVCATRLLYKTNHLHACLHLKS